MFYNGYFFLKIFYKGLLKIYLQGKPSLFEMLTNVLLKSLKRHGSEFELQISFLFIEMAIGPRSNGYPQKIPIIERIKSRFHGSGYGSG